MVVKPRFAPAGLSSLSRISNGPLIVGWLGGGTEEVLDVGGEVAAKQFARIQQDHHVRSGQPVAPGNFIKGDIRARFASSTRSFAIIMHSYRDAWPSVITAFLRWSSSRNSSWRRSSACVRKFSGSRMEA